MQSEDQIVSFQSSINYRDLSLFGVPLTTSGAVSKSMLYAASASNYGAVICLLPHDHSKRVTDAAEILDSQQVDYVHLPVDWLAPTKQVSISSSKRWIA